MKPKKPTADMSELVVAVTKVETAVTSLQGAFEKKSEEDLERFEELEAALDKQAETLIKHAELHTSHARMLTKANEMVIQAVEGVRTEAQKSLQESLEKHALDTTAKLDSLAKAGSERKQLLEKISSFQKKPLFKLAWFIGGLIGGIAAAWFSVHH